MKEPDKAISNRLLRNQRKLHYWTQSQVAEQIGTTTVNVNRWESGITSPSLHFRQRLCDLFGKSPEELGLISEAERHERATAIASSSLPVILHPDAIPEEIIFDDTYGLGPTSEPIAPDPLELDIAIRELRKFSLVRRDPEAQLLMIHRLVQHVLKDRMDEQTQRQWAERVVCAVDRAFPDVTFEMWQRCQRCLPHAQACAALITQWSMTSPEASQLLNRAGYYLYKRAQYTEAETLLRRALAIREKALGLEHPDVAETLNKLVELYYEQGKKAR